MQITLVVFKGSLDSRKELLKQTNNNKKPPPKPNQTKPPNPHKPTKTTPKKSKNNLHLNSAYI